MKIDILKVGELETNCYILSKNKEAIIIDPGAEASRIIEFCKDLNVVGVLLTHSHFDHIGALDEVCENFNVTCNNFNFDNFNLEVIETPGHFFDSKTLYFKTDEVMFTGDFLFEDTFGRVDFPESSIPDMISSIKKMENYSDEITIYPGHGNSSNLGYEKNNFDSYYDYLSKYL